MCVVFCYFFWFVFVCGVVYNVFFMARPFCFWVYLCNLCAFCELVEVFVLGVFGVLFEDWFLNVVGGILGWWGGGVV